MTGHARYLQTAINFGKAIVAEQRPDGGYRMGYGITHKGEACYVADGGEIAIGIARLVSYTIGCTLASAYAYARLTANPKDERAAEAAYAIFSPDSPHSVYKLIAKEKRSGSEWIYLCFSYMSLPDVVKPMTTMKPFEPVK